MIFQQHYEQYLAEYDEKFKKFNDSFSEDQIANFLRNHNTGINNEGRKFIAKLIKLNYQNPSILDAASATAVMHEVLKNDRIEHTYIAHDCLQPFLDHAKKLYSDEIICRRGYVQELCFDDNQFDIVLLRHIGEHLEVNDFYKAIAEAIRVASREAILVFFLAPHGEVEHKLNIGGPNERGCFYHWNEYSHSKLMEYLYSFGHKVEVIPPIYTPGAAHPDSIYRVIKQ